MQNLHFSQLIFAQAKKYGDKVAMSYRENATEQWSDLTWTKFADQVLAVAKALVELGVVEQHRIAQFSQNKTENLIVDFAAFATRATVVPMYATSTAPQVEYIVNDAQIEIIMVGNQQQYNIALEVLQNSQFLKKIIVFDKKVVFKEAAHTMYYHDMVLLGEKSSRHFESCH